jgi:hypothetical protein
VRACHTSGTLRVHGDAELTCQPVIGHGQNERTLSDRMSSCPSVRFGSEFVPAVLSSRTCSRVTSMSLNDSMMNWTEHAVVNLFPPLLSTVSSLLTVRVQYHIMSTLRPLSRSLRGILRDGVHHRHTSPPAAPPRSTASLASGALLCPINRRVAVRSVPAALT